MRQPAANIGQKVFASPAADRKHRPPSFCISGSRPQTSAAKFLHLGQPTANIGRQVLTSRAATANIGHQVFCISGSRPQTSAAKFFASRAANPACRPAFLHVGRTHPQIRQQHHQHQSRQPPQTSKLYNPSVITISRSDSYQEAHPKRAYQHQAHVNRASSASAAPIPTKKLAQPEHHQRHPTPATSASAAPTLTLTKRHIRSQHHQHDPHPPLQRSACKPSIISISLAANPRKEDHPPQASSASVAPTLTKKHTQPEHLQHQPHQPSSASPTPGLAKKLK